MSRRVKILIIAVVMLVVTAALAIGAFIFLHRSGGPNPPAAVAAQSTPKPLFFTDILDITVSLPPAAALPPTAFVQLGLQFSTYDPGVIAQYSQVQPIIKANIISLLMTETSNSLAEPQVRDDFVQKCLVMANQVLAKTSAAKTKAPFTAAYITNLVFQE
ncbi:MAG: hypothetical protein B7Z75_07000 [Acidocella sp. 20-57-95]|nr:MAG: hypothetical protein B7Z75_07000 [Acidocella sp. 20-57-95]HQT63578.1 flagellar basal body-associated FliL family protein [Acidocella sp.]